MLELAKWSNFYVIVGSSAGALIGLQFVVLTLIAQRPPTNFGEAGSAFGSPTVVHFCAALFLSALLQAPWQTITPAAILCGAGGLIGVVYIMIVIGRMRRQAAYTPEFEDWLFHVILPLVAYTTLAVSSFAAFSHERAALFAIAASALLLLFDGIHNAWDNIAYHVLVHFDRNPAETSRADTSQQSK